ncbi:hypothetical protein AAT18_01345 [Rhodococcus aetherivorans]|nr:hypothetical protein AAT18_01345 [Rhodococcus aetherivorans]KDE10453.1 hypothetical protein N505_0126265 [Rhodococcus aetherivorans]
MVPDTVFGHRCDLGVDTWQRPWHRAVSRWTHRADTSVRPRTGSSGPAIAESGRTSASPVSSTIRRPGSGRMPAWNARRTGRRRVRRRSART